MHNAHDVAENYMLQEVYCIFCFFQTLLLSENYYLRKCFIIYRLGNGRLLDVDNPVQVALAYRERLLSFYYRHKIHVS